MKSTNTAVLALALLVVSALAGGDSRVSASAAAPDRAITKVVKLLENMMKSSKADGETERELFAKHKCYCDTNEEAKKAEIEELTMQIGLLESKIDELLASTEKLSKEVAQLKADMTANKDARDQAEALRLKEKTAFEALETDLVTAIGQMKEAIEVLSEVGADQTLGQAAADHEKYMAGYNATMLLKLKTTVKAALVAASATVTKKQATVVEAFLQAPFTATYTSQSAEVVGILKDMKVTFEENLATARAEEAAAVEAHAKYMATMLAAYQAMEASLNKKQAALSSNDEDLATKKTQLADAVEAKAAAEQFLEQLLAMCAEKTKQYDTRVLLRSNEEAAIAEAISILNSDAAFETFGTVSATSTGATSFLQRTMRSRIRRHAQRAPAAEGAPRRKAQALLRKAAASSRSVLLSKVLAFLQAGNPFTIVLEEIEKMVGLIEAEGKADEEQLAWCNSEREANNKALEEKKAQIVELNSAIDTLVQAIDDPETGLKAQIKDSEEQLQINIESQTSQTADRKELNVAYQKDIENLVEAKSLLVKAVAVLKKYYSQILASGAGPSLLQQGPSPPPTWEGEYKGQSGGGGDAVNMLEFILSETKEEEKAAHKAELDLQHEYEDSMDQLKADEATLEAELAQLRLTLAEKEKLLLAKREDLKTTTEEKEAIEAYLEKIKPGCDFITNNIELRKGNREQETAALRSAQTLLKETPAYLTAVEAAHNESLGECLGICSEGEEKAPCKACLAHVTVPAYCAGHKDTAGC